MRESRLAQVVGRDFARKLKTYICALQNNESPMPISMKNTPRSMKQVKSSQSS